MTPNSEPARLQGNQPGSAGADLSEADFSAMLAEARTAMREQRQETQQLLDGYAAKVFDAYRAALGSGFTPQEVIRGAMFGADIEDWRALSTEAQEILAALGAKYPAAPNHPQLAESVGEALIEHLEANGSPASPHQKDLLQAAMPAVLRALDQAGMRPSEEVSKARILGYVPLMAYRDFLTTGGQFYLAVDQYMSELQLTDNAIKAQTKALSEALIAAGDVLVESPGRHRVAITGIKEASVEVDVYRRTAWLEYKAADGRKNKLEITHSSITDLSSQTIQDRAFETLLETPLAGMPAALLGERGQIGAAAGLGRDVREEMRGNALGNVLKRCGVDLSAAPEKILVDPSNSEVATFFYPIVPHSGPTGGMAAVRFDERLRIACLYVESRQEFEASAARFAEVKKRFAPPGYEPERAPISVRDYLKAGKRLTSANP